jgi:hypothetical protein
MVSCGESVEGVVEFGDCVVPFVPSAGFVDAGLECSVVGVVEQELV